ncbi:hypothetical protein CCQ26_16280 [Cronobacter sakazakii]|nr:hypothetical protein CCQ26_16280 [Cronobacter sakazakii]
MPGALRLPGLHNLGIYFVGRVSEAHPPVGKRGQAKGAGRIGKAGEIVPFAITSFPSVPFSHANVQRGLAAAPFAIPAPGGNRPLWADFF